MRTVISTVLSLSLSLLTYLVYVTVILNIKLMLCVIMLKMNSMAVYNRTCYLNTRIFMVTVDCFALLLSRNNENICN